MGFAASLFDTSDDEVKFWRAWNSMPGQERRKFRRRLGIETAKLLKGDSSTVSARQDLAKFVKANVFTKQRGRGARGTKGKRRR